MTTIIWINGTTASFKTAAAWQGGKAPTVKQTAVISSAGDAAPVQNQATYLLSPASGSSIAYLAGLKLDQLTEISVPQTNGTTDIYFTTPAASSVPKGETITGGTIDLLGGGSETGLYLQDSTLAAAAHVNVSGDAYLYAGYTNTLAGTINIGEAFSVNGVPVVAPAADANGFSSAVYLDIQDYGSWDDKDKLSGYVPGVTNSGTINIGATTAAGAASSLVISIAGEATSVVHSGSTYTLIPPAVSDFINKGVITLAAGATIHAFSQYGQGQFINDGQIDITGGAGALTGTGITCAVSGTGTFTVDGGTQSNPLMTVADFNNQVSGVDFVLNGGGLVVDAGTGIAVGTSSCTGGTVSFTGAPGEIQISAPVDDPITKVFTDTLAGFTTGDTIQLNYSLLPLPAGETWAAQGVWNASTDTLDIYNAYTTGGVTTTALEAAFQFSGSYSAASFSVSNLPWNDSDSSPVSVTIKGVQPGAADFLAGTAAAALAEVSGAGHEMASFGGAHLVAPSDWGIDAVLGHHAMAPHGV